MKIEFCHVYTNCHFHLKVVIDTKKWKYNWLQLYILYSISVIINKKCLPTCLYIESTDLQLLLGSFWLPLGGPVESSVKQFSLLQKYFTSFDKSLSMD